MSFSARTSACAARASIREEKRKEKQEQESKEAEAQMKDENIKEKNY